MSMDRPVAGFECTLYLNEAPLGESDSWLEIVNAKDVSFPDAAEEIDVSARYSSRKRYIAGMFDGQIDFGYQFIKGLDPIFTALQAAYLARTPVHIAAGDGPIATPGTIYERDWYQITKFERGEELGNSRVYNLTLKPTVVFDEGEIVERTYVEVPAGP